MADPQPLVLEREKKVDRESNVELGRVTEVEKDIERMKREKESQETGTKKLSSISTIFSVWNTMIGSTILSVPYNVYKAGLLPTIFIGLLYGFICYLTCAVVVKLSGNEQDFAYVVYNYLYYGFGPKAAKVGKYLQIIFNLLINIGAALIYFLIINQNFFPCLSLLLNAIGCDIDADDITPHFDKFSLFYCALIISAVAFPLTIAKELHKIQKFNSYGFILVIPLLIFILYRGIASLATDSFHIGYKENIKGNNDRNLFLVGENIGLIAGTFSLGLFSHSFILPLMKNNRIQENNQRDLFLGYVCVTLTYMLVGIMGYIGFSGSDFSSTFEKNWFHFYKSDYYMILILRICNVIQLMTIFPILFFIIRKQLFETFFKSYVDKRTARIIFSIIMLFLCILVLYGFYDQLAELIGFIGAACALVLVYTIAPLINMINYYIRHESKKEIQKIKAHKEEFLIIIDIDELKPLIPWKAFIFYMCMILIIILGIITLILQIVTINFFNIKIEKTQ